VTSITLDDILQTANEPVSDLPLKTIIDAYFDGTKHMHDFSREVMIPQLKSLLLPTAQEVAFRDIYFKMYLFLGSVQIPTKSPADSEMMSPGDTR
jgi:hypothetical protein